MNTHHWYCTVKECGVWGEGSDEGVRQQSMRHIINYGHVVRGGRKPNFIDRVRQWLR